MTAYRNAPVSGIVSFTTNRADDNTKWMECTFHNGRTYRYTVGNEITLPQLIDMKELASIDGAGLNTYINVHKIGR